MFDNFYDWLIKMPKSFFRMCDPLYVIGLVAIVAGVFVVRIYDDNCLILAGGFVMVIAMFIDIVDALCIRRNKNV